MCVVQLFERLEVPYAVMGGLAVRAPYFHNGLANTLEDVVEYYTIVLDLQLTDADKQDLVAFLIC